MALVNKIPPLRSFYSVCVLHCCLFIQGSYGNHAVKPMLFINFFDDEAGSETINSPNVNENEIKAFSDEGLTNEFLHDSYSATSVYTTNSTETVKSSMSTKLNNSENAMSAFFGDSVNEENGAVKFESPSGDKPEPGMSAEGFDNPESCDNILLQITRIFKAIASLIQHIMDAIFSVNETPNSRLGEAQMFEDDSSPSRRLRKRDIPLGSELSDSTKLELAHVDTNSITEINFVSVKAENKHESTPKTVHEDTEQKSSTIGPTAHSSLGSTSLKQSTSSPTGKPVFADDKKSIPQNDEIVSNADPLKADPSFLLYDQTSGEKQESRHFYHFEHSDEEKKIKKLLNSSNGIVFAITGMVLAVIVIAAAAYSTYMWKNNSYRQQGQHAGPGPSSQRSAMA